MSRPFRLRKRARSVERDEERNIVRPKSGPGRSSRFSGRVSDPSEFHGGRAGTTGRYRVPRLIDSRREPKRYRAKNVLFFFLFRGRKIDGKIRVSVEVASKQYYTHRVHVILYLQSIAFCFRSRDIVHSLVRVFAPAAF